jgi:hypothetical protein
VVVGERHGGVAVRYYGGARRGEEWEWNGFVAWARWRGRRGRRRRLLFDEASRPDGRTNTTAIKVATFIRSCLLTSDQCRGEEIPWESNEKNCSFQPSAYSLKPLIWSNFSYDVFFVCLVIIILPCNFVILDVVLY